MNEEQRKQCAEEIAVATQLVSSVRHDELISAIGSIIAKYDDTPGPKPSEKRQEGWGWIDEAWDRIKATLQRNKEA